MVAKCIVQTVKYQTALIVGFGALFALLAPWSAQLFVSDAEAVARLTKCFYCLSLHMIFNFFIASLANIFR